MKLSLLVAALFVCCTPTPKPAPTWTLDADAASGTCADACDKMRVLGCAGIRPDCAATLQKLQDDRLMRAPSGEAITCACLAAAASPSATEACGVGCLP